MSTTMQFGPEWMRPKTQANSRSSTREPTPPPGSSPAGTSSYSALVTPPPALPAEMLDVTNPSKYSRDEMLRIYKEGGGKGGLGLEVERWEGVVRDFSSDPIALKEMTEADKKLFSGSLNSELRRRQSTDYLSPLTVTTPGGERPKLYHGSSSAGSPMRERFGGVLGRRGTADSPSVSMPRKPSVSSLNAPLASPRDAALPSPRTRSGFDGVLSGADTWMARRRTSDATRPGALAPSRSTDAISSDGRKDAEIKEEKEEDPQLVGRPAGTADGGGDATASTHVGDPRPQHPDAPATEGLHQALGNMSLGGTSNVHLVGTNGHGGHDYPLNTQIVAQPLPLPTTTELASIEWSYVDPAGNVQGPFRADIMQNWHDAGFFTPDLLMKRTHLDSTWMSVGEISARAGTSQIFLVPFPAPPPPPPGLIRRSGSTPDPYSGPFQPIPQRSLRTVTLDTFLGGGPTGLDSPGSSFGAGRFNNNSPDSAMLGGRIGLGVGPDATVGPRFAPGPYSAAPDSQYGSRRGTFNDPMGAAFGGSNSPFGASSHSPAIGGPVYHTGVDHTRTPVENAGPFGSFGTASPAQAFAQPSLSSVGRHRSGSINLGGVEYVPEPHSGGPYSAMPIGQRLDSGALPSDGGLSGAQAAHDASHLDPAFSYSTPTQTSTIPAVLPSQSGLAPPSETIPPAEAQTADSLVSPWGTRETTGGRRVSPFDAPHPKASNTVSVDAATVPRAKQLGGSQPNDSSQPQTGGGPWSARGQGGPTKSARNQSPWVAATNGVVEEGWNEAPGTNKLTFSNLAQHNQQQNDSPTQPSPVAPVVEATPVSQALVPPQAPMPAATTPAETTSTVVEPAPATKQPRRKGSQAASKAATVDTATPAVPVPVEPLPLASTSTKAAWAAPDDKKAKPSSATMGFREIQEAEAKKVEARKAAEKERAARAAASAAAAPDEAPAFTASWGLPTSQAGPRTATGKEQTSGASNTPAPAAAPVWTAATKPAAGKKTMKEIQEEEERRKKQAAKEKEAAAAAAAAARRGYAETTTKSSTPTPAAPGGAWTTVGVGGKTAAGAATAAAAAAPARPTAASVASASATPQVTTARAANGAARAPTSTTAAAVTAPPPKLATTPGSKADEFPLPPSPEFLKWLSDALKGLNSSVNFEDITAMLLSFPPDDPSTGEIISDLIYANSTTLDGRRFASEFVSKRAADVAGRSKGTAKPMTPTSIADVVRSQPKPAAQNEWGGFKVVNKKKKGGRS